MCSIFSNKNFEYENEFYIDNNDVPDLIDIDEYNYEIIIYVDDITFNNLFSINL